MAGNFWTEDKIARAAALWQQGQSARAIGDVLGVKDHSIVNLARRDRGRFPARQSSHPLPAPIVEPVVRRAHPDRVIRTTISGAEVTMPRVPFIDGPAALAT
ncbi:GcrA cell cycle regulator [Rhizobium sp. 12,4]|uniref:GcrA cell cycle regulator n=1 Tax=Rhizobium sp. 12,4 TaxID=3405135 RepID=UPI003D3377F9